MSLKISSLHLQAFFEVAKHLSFSKAAKNLHVTQSALSQRIINFEDSLSVSLFVRDPSGLRLTEPGIRLLRYCRLHETLENEVLAEIGGQSKSQALGGRICIGGFSSLMGTVVTPCLGPLANKHPDVQVEIRVSELSQLPSLLKTGAIDYAILDYNSELADIETRLLGYEKNVLVRPNKIIESRRDVFLDHDSEDQTTHKFFQHNNKKEKIRRIFVDDVYGLIAGVSNGLGSAILPVHMLSLCRNVYVEENSIPLYIPIYVHFCAQPYYSRLHNEFISVLVDAFKSFKKS